jgi:hypothetical protein
MSQAPRAGISLDAAFAKMLQSPGERGATHAWRQITRKIRNQKYSKNLKAES